MRILEAAGYVCTRAGASLGLFDVIAIGPSDVRLVQVKAGTKYLSTVEREQIVGLLVPANVSQTSTYLNAGKMGLQDSMQRFEGIRRNPVASEQPREHPLTSDNEHQETPKPLVN